MEEVLQIILMLGYLAIGLMSITVPTYAITVSFQPRETLESLEEIVKRRKNLSDKLDELGKKLEKAPAVQDIKKEIERFEKEEKRLKDRLECLSVKGAVGYPLVSFALGLIFVVLSIYGLPERFHLPVLASIISIVYGLFRLTKSLLAVEQAALRPEEKLLPIFRVSFFSGALIEECKAKEKKKLKFIVSNEGKEVAEDLDVMFFFPPEFQPKKNGQCAIAPQTPPARYENYNAACFDRKLLHVGIDMVFAVTVKMPEKIGSYQIPVCVRARKMGKSDYPLTINVV